MIFQEQIFYNLCVERKDIYMKPTMIVFMGGQGSGKGTFAKKLMQQQKFNYVEAGAILRAMPSDSDIKQKISRGELVGDNDLFPIITPHITTDTDIILDGFPRTLGQAKWLIEKFADKFNIKIVFLNISEATMLAHIQNRIKEGGNRADDADANAVQKRIAAFKTTTMPAIDWLSTVPNIAFYDIKLPGDDIDINFNYIMKTIK